MMKKTILFQVNATDIEQAKIAIESAAGRSLAAHQSDYRGGGYFRGEFDGVELVLQRNFVEDDGEPTEVEFPDAGLLVYLDGTLESVDTMENILLAGTGVMRWLRSNSY